MPSSTNIHSWSVVNFFILTPPFLISATLVSVRDERQGHNSHSKTTPSHFSEKFGVWFCELGVNICHRHGSRGAGPVSAGRDGTHRQTTAVAFVKQRSAT